MRLAGSSKSGDLGASLKAATSVPQERLGNNGATLSSAVYTENPVTTSLERQAASFGSFDFLKLLETGPNGEPLTFAEILASNPDWTEQSGFQGDAHSRDANASGGATPRFQNGYGDRESGPVGFPSLSSWGQTSLGPIFSTGFSGSFGDLFRHPSFSTQLTKDPSFNSAMLHTLLSQRSEDHAAAMGVLASEQQGSKPKASTPAVNLQEPSPPGKHQKVARPSVPTQAGNSNLSGTPHMPPAQLPREASDAVLAEAAAQRAVPDADTLNTMGPSESQVEVLPVVLPRFSEELEAVKRIPSPKDSRGLSHNWQAEGLQTADLAFKILGRRAALPSARFQDVKLHQQHARLLASLNDKDLNSLGPTKLELPSDQRTTKPSERAASLDYLLGAANLAASAPALAHIPVSKRPTGAFSPAIPLQQVLSARAAGQPAHGSLHRAFQPLSGSQQAALPLEGRSPQPSCTEPFLWAQQGLKKAQVWEVGKAFRQPASSTRALSAAETLRALQLPKPTLPVAASHPSPSLHLTQTMARSLSGVDNSQLAPEPSPHPAEQAKQRPAALPRQHPTWCLPASSALARPDPLVTAFTLAKAASQQSAASQAPKELIEEKEKSRFLSGLLGGIGSRAAQPGGLLLDPMATAAALQMPRPPQMKPLPPLPHVPTIAEFQRTITGSRPAGITSPLEIPRLEVLPLLGVGAAQAPRLEYPSPRTTAPTRPPPAFHQSGAPYHPAPPGAVPAHAFAPLQRQAKVHTPSSKLQPSTHSSALEKAVSCPQGEVLNGGLQSLVLDSQATAEASSSGSLDARSAKRMRPANSEGLAKRKTGIGAGNDQTEIQGVAEEETSQDGSHAQDRKALRKAKNRASAAASRARREAYTCSLEDKVKQLQQKRAWLLAQLENTGVDPQAESVGKLRGGLKRQLSL